VGNRGATNGFLVLLLGSQVVACSFIYDTDKFEGIDDAAVGNPDAPVNEPDGRATDASTDGAIPDANQDGADATALDAHLADADLAALALDDVSPDQVYEGEGSHASAPPVVFLIEGSNIAEDATVTPSRGDVVVLQTETSSDGTMLAVSLRIPVIAALGEGASEMLTLTVAQPGASDSVELTLEGLDELDISTAELSATGELYSQIRVQQNVQLTGNEPARLRATGQIVIDGSLSASGTNSPLPGAPGPGGCVGGTAENDGSCGGGGLAGAYGDPLGSGGGGGSCTGEGSQGELSGGLPGTANCVLFFQSFGSTNQGNGGGGGGTSPTGTGGLGGGGGGSLELTAGASIKIGANVSANGGNGLPGSGTGCTEHGGGGGGGSGGMLLVRAPVIERTAGMIRAEGGLGGESGGPGSACAAGGDGGKGSVRVDSGALVASSGGDSTFVHGPMLALDMTWISTTTMVPVAFIGEPDTIFAIEVDGAQPLLQPTDLTGRGVRTIDMAPGIHEVCTIQIPVGTEFFDCRRIAVVP